MIVCPVCGGCTDNACHGCEKRWCDKLVTGYCDQCHYRVSRPRNDGTRSCDSLRCQGRSGHTGQCHWDPALAGKQPTTERQVVKITVSTAVTVERVDGSSTQTQHTRSYDAGDNPRFELHTVGVSTAAHRAEMLERMAFPGEGDDQ